MRGTVLGGLSAHAEEPDSSTKTRATERLAPFGLMLDAGIPDGTGLSAAFRTSRSVRLDVGATYNGIRLGARAGITLLPMQGGYTPSVTFEVGHALTGDSQTLARRMADLSQPPLFAMDRVGFTYASSHLGFEVGVPGRYSFFMRGGLSFIELDVPNVEDLGEPFVDSLGKMGAKGGRFVYTMPSASSG